MTKPVKVRLDSLVTGDWFRLGTQEGQLVYKNDCRVRVCLGSKQVFIKGKPTFVHKIVTDWGPGTEVIKIGEPTEKDEVKLDEEENENE